MKGFQGLKLQLTAAGGIGECTCGEKREFNPATIICSRKGAPTEIGSEKGGKTAAGHIGS